MVADRKVDVPVDSVNGNSASARGAAGDSSTASSINQAMGQISNALIEGQNYLKIQVDRSRVAARNLFLFLIIGAVAAIIAATVLVCATVLLCIGLAAAVGTALGGRMWAGDLIVGAIVIVFLLGTLLMASRRIQKAARERTIREYQQQQKRN